MLFNFKFKCHDLFVIMYIRLHKNNLSEENIDKY